MSKQQRPNAMELTITRVNEPEQARYQMPEPVPDIAIEEAGGQ